MLPVDQQRFPATGIAAKTGEVFAIRPLDAGDTAGLAALFESVPRADLRHYYPHPLDREHAARDTAKALSPCEVVLVAEAPGGDIAGYAWYRWKEPQAATSTFGICIGRPWQGAGIGRALMNRLLEIAREIGPPVMGLTVQLANQRALALYRSMGFEVVREQIVGERLGFAAEPEYCMERRRREG